MISHDLIRKIRRIHVRTSHAVDTMLAGQYPSAFKGYGVEFEEVRPYQVGDDVRSIDWNVTARSGSPHVKLFREERELALHLVVDVSGSQSIGTQRQLKRELAAELAALLAFSAIQNNDKVGLMLFSDRVEKVVPPGKGVRHVLRIVRDLLEWQPAGRGTSLRAALERFSRTVKRRCVVFLVSDFHDTGYEAALRIVRRKHDVVAVVIGDPRESELPRVGLVQWVDPETGTAGLLDTNSREQRHTYQRKAREWADRCDRLFDRLNVDRIELRTGEDPVGPLRRFLDRRGKRR